MKNFLTNFNWYSKYNWILLMLFITLVVIDIAKENYVYAFCNGFVAIFNMFLILVLNQRAIMDEQEEQKEREEEIIKILKEKGE